MDQFPKNNAQVENTEENLVKHRVFEIRRRARHEFDVLMEDIWRDSSRDAEAFIENLKASIVKIIPGITEDKVNAFDTLYPLKEKTEKTILSQAANIIIQLIAEHVSLEEFEDRLKVEIKEESEELSRGLYFNLDTDENAIRLRTPLVFFENSKLALQSAREGLIKLAHIVATEERMKNVKEIVGFSLLVLKKYHILAELGFEIPLGKDSKPITNKATMSREKLLEIYGQPEN